MPPPDPSQRLLSPWLSLFLPLVVSVGTAALSFAVQWGTLGADVRHLEAAHTDTRGQVMALQASQVAGASRLATVEAEQLGTRRQMETELAGVRRELERMARALERLTDEPTRTSRR
jgi:hypothetical protein